MTAKQISILKFAAVLAFGIQLHATPKVICNAASGVQFNLEPNTHPAPQQFEAVDFIPNGVALNEDLVVGGAYDFRGTGAQSTAPAGVVWDGSVSGYYVHRSTAEDCSAEFEGGLPPIVSKGITYNGNGGVAIAADPARNAFFVADFRFEAGSVVATGLGLFRASAATLLNTTLCPNGTHTLAQAKSCWGTTPPVIVGSGVADDFPSMAVDERTIGTGAGNVYLASQNLAASGGGIVLVACTNATLSCSSPVTISASGEAVADLGTGNAYVQVRPDGDITITYLDEIPNNNPDATTNNVDPHEPIKFVLCTPAGAPKAPVCSAPTLVATENTPLGDGIFPSLTNTNLLVTTQARHANRLEADGKTITTFVVWDRCNVVSVDPTGAGLSFSTCINAEVDLATSTNGGKTWTTPVKVNTAAGHQFMPGISTDESTGTVNIVYYNTTADVFHRRMVVTLNQIAAGSTAIGAPLNVISTPEPWDADPTQNPFAVVLGFFDLHLGLKARGMGSVGNSRVYSSFTSTADRRGVFGGESLPEQNNNLQEVTY